MIYDASLEEGFCGDGPIAFERKFYIGIGTTGRVRVRKT